MPFREYETHGDNVGLGIDLINTCNLRCKQCFYKDSPQKQKMMSLDQVKHIIDKASQNGFTEFYILGGEPTLHPQLKEILELALAQFKVVILVTNGMKLANEKYCKSIALPGLAIATHRMAIKDSAEPLVNYLSGTRTAWDQQEKAWLNIEKYWQGDINMQLNLMKPLIQEGHAFNVFVYARQHGFEPIIELTKPGPIYSRGNPLDVTPQEIQILFTKMQQYDKEYFPEHYVTNQVPPSLNHNCTLVETGLHISVDGDIIPCVGHFGITLGNIFSDDFVDILNSPIRLAMKDFQNWIVGPCKQCELFQYCRGGCRGEAYWQTGCPRASDPYCWHHKPETTLEEMTPENCIGCPLEHNPACNIKI